MYRIILLLISAQLILTFNTLSQHKFYSKQDSLDYRHYSLILSKGYSFSVENGAVKRVLVDSSYLESDKYIPYDSALKIIRSIPKFSYSTHSPNKEFTSLKELNETNQYDSITQLSISGKSNTKLPLLRIIKCKNLKEIELVGTNIRKIPWMLNWKVFGLDSLKTIRVYNHAPGVKLKFAKNDNIEKFVFRDSPYSPAPHFYKLKNLIEVDLVQNDFAPDTKFNFEKFKKLDHLNLSKNSISIKNLAKDTVHSLGHLILSFNNLQSVDQEIGYFKDLTDLQLAENDIVSENIDLALGTLTNLEILSFYKNELDSIPPFIFNLNNLIELDLYYNEIEKLPSQLGELTKLERLYIAHNKFYSIPESVGKLRSLKEFYIHHNRVSYLPQSIGNLEHITDFHIQNNYFQGFPEFVLNYRKLEDLDVSNNEIEKLPKEILQLENLKYLWMKGITFLATDKAEANDIKNTLESLQKKGVKVSIDLE
ncbi:leucine-rich repeat domain-containing protein [Marivirga arenosa]|uniref:Leucine-rich repeat domain-containing protein n=1 Tax=Marivirga arenosa TaxID=3059076 RepID=A0AA51ZUP0_9BACT|nr:leucine-rich repeat domain-containing protein [Marivirga sp. BKB1-2]WNB16813.1 leucine-rich repeat domain-containing protein [Marivirga sp. BKB1-2]